MGRRLCEFFSPEEVRRDGGFSGLGQADGELPETLAYCDSIFYLSLANRNPRVSCILTTTALAAKAHPEKGLAVVARPRNSFYRLHERLLDAAGAARDSAVTRIHPSAIVAPGARLGAGVVVGERVVIGDDVNVGDGAFIDAGAVVGVEGLLYVEEQGNHHRVRHAGGVMIGRGASVLANAVIVRAIHAGLHTEVGEHAIVGIATTVGHDAILGRNCVISGNCVVARGARVGEHAWIGTAATIREYVRIGAHASVKAGSVVIEDVPDHAEVSGNFAIAHDKRVLQHLKDRK